MVWDLFGVWDRVVDYPGVSAISVRAALGGVLEADGMGSLFSVLDLAPDFGCISFLGVGPRYT